MRHEANRKMTLKSFVKNMTTVYEALVLVTASVVMVAITTFFSIVIIGLFKGVDDLLVAVYTFILVVMLVIIYKTARV